MDTKDQNILKDRKLLALVAGMVFLVVLSSCTVRKFISYELDLPFIKLLNPSRATIHTGAHCSLDEMRVGYHSLEQPSVDTSLLTSVTAEVEYSSPDYPSAIPLFYPSQGWPLSLKIPVYILFKKIKDWI
ncbi:hypothetical protein ACT29H_03355 [Thermophagus sp. OGC60D27]|uniref:hypothetical protein n=1 Tax=Thermophagus sp. OGC60D27 TaxID=3458415 RepID=UPI004037FDC6